MRLLNGTECGNDPDVVSHWSQWLGHRNPKLLIVGQDFSNVDYFRRHGGRDAPGNETNENLYRLLTQEARIPVGRPPVSDPDAAVYLTNSILCLKEGEMKAPVYDRWINTCSDKHLAPLVGLLRPRAVVGMGSGGWRAVRRLFGLKREPPGVLAAAGRMWEVSGTLVFAVGHCGGLGLRNRPREQQAADWRRIGEAIASLPG